MVLNASPSPIPTMNRRINRVDAEPPNADVFGLRLNKGLEPLFVALDHRSDTN